MRKGGLSTSEVAAKYMYEKAAIDMKFDSESNVFFVLHPISSCCLSLLFFPFLNQILYFIINHDALDINNCQWRIFCHLQMPLLHGNFQIIILARKSFKHHLNLLSINIHFFRDDHSSSFCNLFCLQLEIQCFHEHASLTTA